MDSSQSLLTAEIAQWHLQGPEQLVLTPEQVIEMEACIRWKNTRLKLSPTRDSHAFSQLVVVDGFHKVMVGKATFNIVNWCVMFEDYKRRLGMTYHDPLRRYT